MQVHLGTTATSSFELRLRARPESAFLLRQRLALWLDELGADSGEVFDVSLAVTEAFANAVEHPCEPTAGFVEVEGSCADRTITLTIRDSGSWGVARQRAGGGYGFPLMHHLMDTVEVDAGSDGTSIRLQRLMR